MDSKTRTLIGQENMLVFIDDIQLGGGNRQKRIVLPGLIEKFIINIQLQHIAGFQPGIPVCSAAVELNALDADIFLRQRCWQQRDCFSQKTIQPLAGIIGANGKFLHIGFLNLCLRSP